MTEATAKELKHRFPGCRVLHGGPPDVARRLVRYPMCRAFRRWHPNSRRLIDTLLVAEGEYVIVSHPKVVWLRSSDDINACLHAQTPFYVDGGLESYARSRDYIEGDLGLTLAENVYTGTIGYRRADFQDLDFIQRTLESLVYVPRERLPYSHGYLDDHIEIDSKRSEEALCWWTVERTLYALLLGRAGNAKVLNNGPGDGPAHQFGASAPIEPETVWLDYMSPAESHNFFGHGVAALLERAHGSKESTAAAG